MLSFNFNGKDSYLDFGLFIERRPDLPSPKRRVSYINIPGRHSNLRYDEETYEDITLAVECSLKGNAQNRIDEVKAWLLNAGESELIFSFQKDRKYIAQVVNSIDFSIILKITSRFVILFNCRPFKYAVSNSEVSIETGLGTSLLNIGSAKSKPTIKVYCDGDGSFTINNRTVDIVGFDKTVLMLDSELEEAYYTSEGAFMNANNFMSGEFPILDMGNNIITFTGGVTKLVITPNWRWLS